MINLAILADIVNNMTSDQKIAAIFGHPLTGLPNRKVFELMGTEMKWVTIVDIDNLKSVNDTQGHEAGDELIKRVARMLAEILPKSVNLYHLSGDEFVITSDDPDTVQACLFMKPNGYSYGIGKTLQEADFALQVNKATRLKMGFRKERRNESHEGAK